MQCKIDRIMLKKKKVYIHPQVVVIPIGDGAHLMNDSPATTHTVATEARGWAKDGGWSPWNESEDANTDW